MKFKVGDKVKIINTGQLYDAYEDFIKENAPQLLNKWERERDLPDGGSYEVKAIGKHRFGNELAIIEQNNKVYIVDFKGLELVKQFTKSDLKDNHIVVTTEGGKYIWVKDSEKYINEDLTNCFEEISNIAEVWEFDKLVWKREEPILDEIEIIEENKPIKKIIYTSQVADAEHQELRNKVNELVDEINKLKKESDR